MPSPKPKIMNTKTAAIIIGLAFLAVGILGYFDNPIVGSSANAIFHTDQTHNIVHLASGILFLLIAVASPGSAGFFMKLFGIVYLALGIYGAATMGAEESKKLLGFLHVNKADNYLHIGLGVVIFLASLAGPRTARA
jgi:hypothetical protein